MLNPYAAHFLQENFHRECGDCFSRQAMQLYRRARVKGMLRLIVSLLMRRPRRLLSLEDIVSSALPEALMISGVMPVALDQIQGSEGRGSDFDRAFYPIRDHVRNRWLGIANARERGVILPPVSLVRAGDIYFVRDGHHRISVARTRGEVFIDAEVIAWRN